MNKLKHLIILLVLVAFAQTAWAQNAFGNLPAEAKAEDATITEFGHATMTMKVTIVTDSLTQRTDTLREVTNIEWDTKPGTAKLRNSERGGGGNNPNGSGFYNEGHSWWLDIYYYNYNYPSIDADGKPVLLSSMACMPDEDCDYINNVIIGCHVTITSNKECPTSYKNDGSKASDIGMLMNHASSGMVFHSLQKDAAYYNLVIMPDYEGYGITRDHAHPYLYQELTARQVVDGVRYGIALYNSSPTINSIRHSFRSGWRSICVGYSQGGSVAMATQRFIEQNGLSNELRLAGSVCGDGPYDPIATLMYYVKQYNDGDPMSMPVVMPLILKGMCDYNPYMKNHQVSDYLKQEFLDSGILQWLTDKEKSTDDITDAWIYYYRHNFTNWTEYIYENSVSGALTLKLKLHHIMTPEALEFFQQLYNDYKNIYTSTAGVPLPTQRGLMYDLQYALASNNLTKGWVPQHAIFLYHSKEDSVVPEVNRESAGNSFGEWVIKLHASGAIQYDHIGTGTQFFVGTAEFEAIRHLAKAPVEQTIANAIQMKNDISTGFHTLDSWDNPPVIHNDVVHAPVIIDGVEVDAEYRLMGTFARLGSGNNACIPMYSAGKVEVPASITHDGVEYPVHEVAAVAFRMCSHISEIVLPEGIYSIGNFAFQGCQALTTVNLPSTLSSIGSGAFIDLPLLDRINLQAQMPPQWLYNDVFKFHTGGIGDDANYTYNIMLCVPEVSIQTYRQAYYNYPAIGWNTYEGWGNFTDVVALASTDAEAYATYKDGTLTFYYDAHRQHRYGVETYGFTQEEYNSYFGFPGWMRPNNSHANDITTVVFTSLFSYARLETTSRWFQSCVNLDTIIGLHNLNTEMVTDMSHMFYRCYKLTDDDLDFSHFSTASVTTMLSMFEDCVGLVNPDLSNFDTRMCSDMRNMFKGCTGLTSLDLSMFETTNCDFDYMFNGCSNLESLNIGSFGVTNNSYICRNMFSNCSRLHELVIPTAFNSLTEMFGGCNYLYDVYCYKPVPFEVWRNCDLDFNVSFPNYTRFHVLAETYDAWVAQYGNTANVTFVGDLGTEDNPILIYSVTDWINISNMVENDHVVYAKMMNNINVTTMMGSYEHPFMGVFDGNGHTLNVEYNIPSNQTLSNNYIPAPFSYIQSAEIKNLKVEGNITVDATPTSSIAGGLVGCCKKESDSSTTLSTITNCHVATHIIGNIKNLGGIIGKVDNYVVATVSGCLFEGTLSAYHSYYLVNNINAGAIACVIGSANLATLNINNCVERGSYPADVNNRMFCPTTVTPVNGYFFTPNLEGHARRAYSITTDTEGLLLDFGTPTATHDVSGITAYNLGLKLDGVFHAGSGQQIPVKISAPGYEYSGHPTISGGDATLSTNDNINYTVTLGSADVIIRQPGMVFTTVILYDDATDNSLTLERYIDQTYKVQLKGRTLSRSYAWNTLCLPFDVPILNGTPLEGARLKVLDTITFENKVTVFHFKDTTAITANKPYLVRMAQTVEDPVFNNVRIKRSLPPGMKIDVGDLTQTGFVVEGNYNRAGLMDITGADNNYVALYFDRASLRRVSTATTLNAFRCFFEVCISLNDVVAAVLDIESGENYLAIIDHSYSDIDNIFYKNGAWNEENNWAMKDIPSYYSKLLIEGQATIPADYVASVDEIVIDAGSITIADGGQLFTNSEVQATVMKNITGHGGDNDSGWNFIATPLAGTTQAADVTNLISTTAANYDLFYYDEDDHYWRNYKESDNSEDPNFNLSNGQGYLYANHDDTELQFTGTLQAGYNDSYTVENLSFASGDDNLKGFNLVGNPFPCNATITDAQGTAMPFYVIDGTHVVANTGGSTVIPPCTGVMVKATASGQSVIFTKTTAQQSSHPSQLQIVLSQASSTRSTTATLDNAIVSFNEGEPLDKFYFGTQSANIYLPQGNEEFAIVSAEAAGEMPLNFKAKENGSYTLMVNPEGVEMVYLHLIDNMTGADVDLLQTPNVIAGEDPQSLAPSYTFTAKTTDYESRFKLVFCAKVEDGAADGSETFAFMSNGDIIVNGEGTLQMIDMTGRIVVSDNGHARCVSTTGMTPGVYVLRLVNGDDVKTQKIVVE